MSVALHISGTIHHTIVICGANVCKIIIYPGVFYKVKMLIFLIVKELKEKKLPKMTKMSVCRTLYFKNQSYDLHLWYTCMYKSIISPGIFFIFFKILIIRIIRKMEVVLKVPGVVVKG